MNKSTLTPMVVGYIIKNNQVLLGLRKKVSWGLGENLVSGIGGKVGDILGLENESHEEALIREFQEEVGVTPVDFEHMGKVTFVFPNKAKWNQVVEIYTISKWLGEPTETEVIEPKWYDKNKLPLEMMWDDNRLWVPQALQGEKIDLQITYNDDNKTVKRVLKTHYPNVKKPVNKNRYK